MSGRLIIHLAIGVGIAAALLIGSGCSVEQHPVAGGVETTNGLVAASTGMTVRGTAPVGAVVWIFPVYFQPLTGGTLAHNFHDSIAIGSEATFSFSSIPDSGRYNIIAVDTIRGTGAKISQLHVWRDGGDSISVPFEPLGKIRGTVYHTNSSSDTVIASGEWVYLEGSNFYCRSDSSGAYLLKGVPMGSYRPRIWSDVMVVSAPYLLDRDVEINAENPALTIDLIRSW